MDAGAERQHPRARAPGNYVDHNLSDQASIINMIEYNWHLPGMPGSANQVLARTDRSERVPFDLAGMVRRPPARRPKTVARPVYRAASVQPVSV